MSLGAQGSGSAPGQAGRASAVENKLVSTSHPRWILWAAALLVVASGDSCSAPNEQSFVILRASPLTADAAGVTCADTGGAVSDNTLDLSVASVRPNPYFLCPVVQNNLLARPVGGIEHAQLLINGASVEISFNPKPDIAFADNELKFTQALYTFVNPGGKAALRVNLIPRTVVDKLLQVPRTTIATIKLNILASANGDTVTSNDMIVRVYICQGCLLRNIGQCCAAASQIGSSNPEQDVGIECCDSPEGLKCPAVPVAGSSCGAPPPAADGP